MVYENLSRDELRKIAKGRGIPDFAIASKPKLVRMLNTLDETTPSQPIEKDIVKKIIKGAEKQTKEKVKEDSPDTAKIISSSAQVKNWKAYLTKLGISAEDYLTRYPNHISKRFIQELLT